MNDIQRLLAQMKYIVNISNPKIHDYISFIVLASRATRFSCGAWWSALALPQPVMAQASVYSRDTWMNLYHVPRSSYLIHLERSSRIRVDRISLRQYVGSLGTLGGDWKSQLVAAEFESVSSRTRHPYANHEATASPKFEATFQTARQFCRQLSNGFYMIHHKDLFTYFYVINKLRAKNLNLSFRNRKCML